MQNIGKICCVALLLGGCTIVVNAGAVETAQTRTLSEFDRVEASNGIDVTLSCGEGPKATVHGDSKDVENTLVRVEGHVLRIERESLFGNHNRSVQVDVISSQPVEGLTVSSGATLKAPACIVSKDHLELSGSSGGTMKLAATTGRLNADVSSGSSIAPLQGAVIDAVDARVTASSGGTLRFCSIKHLSGKATLGGTITADIGEMGDVRTGMGGTVNSMKCK